MKIKRVEHVAIAVKDLQQMSDVLESVFGMRRAYSEDFPTHGTRLAMYPVGETYLELLEGYTPQAGASKWLDEHGQSLYHLCLEVDDIEAALAELRDKGIRLINETPITGHGGSRVAFVDPADTGNLLFELVEEIGSGQH